MYYLDCGLSLLRLAARCETMALMTSINRYEPPVVGGTNHIVRKHHHHKLEFGDINIPPVLSYI